MYHLLIAEAYHDTTATRVEVFNLGLQAVREGFGHNKFIMGLAPLGLMGTISNGMRIGDDCAPIWRKVPDKWPWGCVEALTSAARRYYFAPAMWRSDQDCAYFGLGESRVRWDVANQPMLSAEQSIAWLTGAAMTGGVLKIGDAFSDLSSHQLAVLKKLLPAPNRPARPVDLFERENPRVWVLPVQCAIGEWWIVALFNWQEDAEWEVSLGFGELGIPQEGRYALFDFWAERCLDVVSERLTTTVRPASVRLLSVRPYRNRPMFLSTNRHFTQGATDFHTLTWNEKKKALRGVLDGVEATDYRLRFLLPRSYRVTSFAVSCGRAEPTLVNEVLTFAFRCEESGPVEWMIGFENRP
jgi:hypothetical protein